MHKNALVQLGELKKHVVESGKASTTTAPSTTTEWNKKCGSKLGHLVCYLILFVGCPLKSNDMSSVQNCLTSPHHALRFLSAYRTCRLTSWAPIDNAGCNETPAVPDERPAYDSLANYVGTHGRLRLTGRATLAAAKMATDSPTLHYGIHGASL